MFCCTADVLDEAALCCEAGGMENGESQAVLCDHQAKSSYKFGVWDFWFLEI